ncbi:MAG: carboxypeptidase-like regulatory domain-containing protein [Spirosomaceae bacterium]|jgi:hypothetical protein|nr:carboxypeptidase-like regulatory domain-containing protein [Spirosomataceae bacterium]
MKIIIKSSALAAAFWCYMISTAIAQSTQITGKVYREGTEEPIVGASITIKGTNRGTITDETGQYVLNVKSKLSILVAKYDGFQPMELPIASDGAIKVVQNFELIDKNRAIKKIFRLIAKSNKKNPELPKEEPRAVASNIPPSE